MINTVLINRSFSKHIISEHTLALALIHKNTPYSHVQQTSVLLKLFLLRLLSS